MDIFGISYGSFAKEMSAYLKSSKMQISKNANFKKCIYKLIQEMVRTVNTEELAILSVLKGFLISLTTPLNNDKFETLFKDFGYLHFFQAPIATNVSGPGTSSSWPLLPRASSTSRTWRNVPGGVHGMVFAGALLSSEYSIHITTCLQLFEIEVQSFVFCHVVS